MKWDFEKAAGLFTDENSQLLLDGLYGIEREAQRITPDGELAMTPHPAAFGNKLENTMVTVDFSESQIELITPPFESVEKMHEFLKELHLLVDKELGSEYLWPLSMPPGADIIIRDIREKPDEGNYSVIELNFNPALHIHNYPYKGMNRQVGKKVLDLLGF